MRNALLSFCYSVNLSGPSEVADDELVRIATMLEREYYGYISDNELIQAMDRLLNLRDTSPNQETNGDSYTTTETMESMNTIQSIQTKEYQDDDSDEFY